MRFPLRVPFLIAYGVFPVFGLMAQSVAGGALPAGRLVPVPAKYAAEPLVIVSMDDAVRMQADGMGVQEKTVVARIQAESALKQLAVISLGFAANSQHVEWVYARIRHKDGTVTETPVDSAIEVAEQVTREAPFYSDLKESQLPLKDLRVGDQLEWKGRIVRTKPEAPGEFWGQGVFTRDGVVLAETVELDVPKDKYVHVWSPNAKPLASVEGDRQLYRWSSQNLKPTVGAEAEADKDKEKKRVRTAAEELDAREGKLPDVAWTTFKSWEAVGAWYRGLEGERMVPDAEIKAKVAELTAGKTTDEAKVQAVYNYVATQIHYIGVAFGVGRYQPHNAGDVLSNQYGDCKDKHTLLAAMLEALGLKPDAVLIGAGIRFNEAVPSPQAFNHLITRVALNGKTTWLDTTAEVAPFGMLIYPTRDKQALAVPDAGVVLVVRTPAQPPFPSMLTMDSTGVLNDQGTSNSKITWTLRGDEEVALRAVFRQVSPAQYDQLLKQMCGAIGYSGETSHLEISRVDDTSEPFKISFDYKRDKAGDWDNLKTIPQLYPAMTPRPEDKEHPVESLQLGAPHVETSTAAMTLPEGWLAELPEAVHLKSAWMNYDLTYRLEKGVLYSQRRYEILQDRVPVADQKSYDKIAEKIAAEDYVQLVGKYTGRGPGKGPISATDAGDLLKGPFSTAISNSAEAAKLVHEAFDAIKRRDLELGESLLEQAKKLNPMQADLETGYGNLNLARGNRREAIADYLQEVSNRPTQVRLYPVIANLQYAESQYAESEISGKHALESTSGDAHERMELLVGKAQMRDGHKEDGHTTLLELLKATENPDIMNDAAYELADAGLELPLADKTTRIALDKLEEESRTWTLDEDLTKLKARNSYLQATWDTIGWILFREGKIDEAESYVRASWLGRQNAEVGKHIAAIALAHGDKEAALDLYEMAIAASSPGDLRKELEGAAEKLRHSGAHEPKVEAAQALRNMRIMPLGPGKNGYAEYKLLINAQGLVRAEPTGDKTVPEAEDRIRQAKFSELFPKGSAAQLVLDIILNCHQGTCDLIPVN
jgi:tetratricopeptide (TPR) repeat protein